ncbi:MAG: amidohydrolase family protein [Pirellulales bacterium]
MAVEDIPAIDIHGHYGQYVTSGGNRLANQFASADATEVVERARRSNIAWTVVSPLLGLMPRGCADAAVGNSEATNVVERTEGLLQWVVIDPTQPQTFQQADDLLGREKCVGIKIHPEEHCYPIREHGRAIFEFAAKHKALILTHSGEENSLPEDFVPLANDLSEVTLILAHIGCGWDGDPSHQVRAIQASAAGNIYADTSSAQSILPGLIEWAVAEVGVDRVLFGTDTPLYSTAMQRARIDRAELSEIEKRKILYDNTASLLNL